MKLIYKSIEVYFFKKISHIVPSSFIPVFLALVFVCQSKLSSAQTYPVPAPLDTTAFGENISRTMTLLATSTPAKRNRVKILFYGQSITRQDWWKDVKKDLETRFPHADLIVENRAVGGFSSPLLRQIANHDVIPFYPDLIIFHDYGGEQEYERMIRNIRSRTTAEMLIQNDHIAPTQSEWHEEHSFNWLPNLSKKYGLEMADIRTPWKRYLQDNQLDGQALLSDQVHLNKHGDYLLASLIKPHLRYAPKYPADPHGLVTTYEVGKDVFFENGKLSLPFTGNRVEVIAAQTKGIPVSADVRIDGKKPSEFPGGYVVTRPNDIPGKSWPWQVGAILQVSSNTQLVVENWTATITKINESADKFTFKVEGSVTGPDGKGSNTSKFVSKSGRVVIAPEAWFIKQAHDNVNKIPVEKGHQIKWSVVPMFTDVYTPVTVQDPSREYATVLAHDIPNTDHILELVAQGAGVVPIKYIRVYKPYVPNTSEQ